MSLTFTAVAPTNPGPYNFQWQWVKDGLAVFGDPSPNLVVTVRPPAPPLAITTVGLSDGSLGVPFLQQLAASGGAPPYTW